MVVYHGSNHRFRSLRIEKSLVECRSTMTNEGLGIYFSKNKEVAKSYGRYVYTIDIPDEVVIDFTDRATCKRYYKDLIKTIDEKNHIKLEEYISYDIEKILIDRMYLGGQCLFSLGREIYNILDSNENWWCDGKVLETKKHQVESSLRSYSKNLIAYTFSYHIPDIGVIKKPGLKYARITKREEMY